MEEDPEIDWDDVRLTNYVNKVTRPTAWYQSAIELIAGAEALAPLVVRYWDSLRAWQEKEIPIFNEHSHHQTFLMLYAFAIENYCKGALVLDLNWEERVRMQRSGHFPKRLRTHDMKELVQLIGLNPISLEEEELLIRLTEAAKWGGRYPVPTHFRDNVNAALSDGKTYSISYFGRIDVDRARSLATRVREHVGARVSYRVQR